MEDPPYLQPDFDPSTLTVPRLRSILLAHNVNYPSSAKKGQLVELFNEQVVSQAKKIRAANARVKRTSKGIVDVPPSQSAMNGDEDVEQLEPPPMSRSRRSTRARTEEPQEIAPSTRGGRHSTAPPEDTPRRVLSKHARAAETAEAEPEPKRPASRTSRQNVATPIAEDEVADQAESPFSSENVFQTGSSPPAPPSREAERRRITASAARGGERQRSREVRRRPEDVKPARPQMDGAVVPSRKTFEMPVSAIKKDEDVEPTEEFTPEENQELIQAQQAGELMPARRRRNRTSSGAILAVPWITSVILAVLAALWRQEKLEVGYCGVGKPSTEIAGVQVPDWAELVRPQCEPCPPHAYCGEKLETTCDPGFVLTQHPLSLGGLLPLPPTCVPDSAKARKVNAVKERAVEELREQNAKYECGEAASPEVKETELKQAISTKRRKGMSNEEFEDLWASAMGEVQGADEVISGSDGSGFTLRSTSLARVPLSCAVRRSLRETLRQYFWQLVGLLLLASSGAYGRYAITSGQETERRAKELAGMALEKLSLQAALHARDPDTWGENYISMAQLRDDVLRDEFSASRRKNLWEKVQQKVESNANVRPMVREGRSGDVGRVWEWVGAIGMLESPSGSGAASGGNKRRQGNRVSFGGVTSERLIEPSDDSTAEVTKWEEGRQYY